MMTDNEQSAKVFLSCAQEGDPVSQYMIASMYLDGDGVEQNNEQAYNWALKAAEQKNTDGIRLLAYMYTNGIHVNQNHQKSFKLNLEAASYGDDKACCNVARSLLYGKGTKQDPKAAYDIFLQVSERSGMAYAQYYLGVCHEEGLGTEKILIRHLIGIFVRPSRMIFNHSSV